MTEDTARNIANATLAAAVVGAAYVVLRNPPLRRLAWRLAVAGLTGTLPAWLNQEVRRAWAQSAPHDQGPRVGPPGTVASQGTM